MRDMVGFLYCTVGRIWEHFQMLKRRSSLNYQVAIAWFQESIQTSLFVRLLLDSIFNRSSATCFLHLISCIGFPGLPKYLSLTTHDQGDNWLLERQTAYTPGTVDPSLWQSITISCPFNMSMCLWYPHVLPWNFTNFNCKWWWNQEKLLFLRDGLFPGSILNFRGVFVSSEVQLICIIWFWAAWCILPRGEAMGTHRGMAVDRPKDVWLVWRSEEGRLWNLMLKTR